MLSIYYLIHFFSDLENESISIFFTTPEMLQTTRFRKILASKQLRQRVCLLACDEAHCVSQWYVLASWKEKFPYSLKGIDVKYHNISECKSNHILSMTI